MPHYNTIFNQLFQFIPGHHFEKMVTELKMDNYCKSFTSWKQFLTLLYAQISGKESLREIESGLLSNKSKLYHLGLDSVARSTLGDAMNRRNPKIFEALFHEVLRTLTKKQVELILLLPTTSNYQQQQWQRFIISAGRLSCFSNGSSRTSK